jgi:hypothetical protein
MRLETMQLLPGGGCIMTRHAYHKEITALLMVDPYNDFISEGGKIWDRIKGVAEANDCVPNMLQVLNAARAADFAFSMRCIGDTVPVTTRPGNILRPSSRHPGRAKASNTARGVARSGPGSSPSQARSSQRSTGVPVASPTPIWIYSSRITAYTSSS